MLMKQINLELDFVAIILCAGASLASGTISVLHHKACSPKPLTLLMAVRQRLDRFEEMGSHHIVRQSRGKNESDQKELEVNLQLL